MNPGPSVGVGNTPGSPGVQPLSKVRSLPFGRVSAYFAISFCALLWSAASVASVRPITQTRRYFDLMTRSAFGALVLPSGPVQRIS